MVRNIRTRRGIAGCAAENAVAGRQGATLLLVQKHAHTTGHERALRKSSLAPPSIRIVCSNPIEKIEKREVFWKIPSPVRLYYGKFTNIYRNQVPSAEAPAMKS